MGDVSSPGLFANADVPDGVLSRPPLGEGSFNDAELGDNLVGGVSGLLHSGSGSVEAPDKPKVHARKHNTWIGFRGAGQGDVNYHRLMMIDY
jgi:hypothetical protein